MIVIGDIHGCLLTLKALIAKFPKDQEFVFVGDLIDRGPRSAEVVKFIRENGYKTVRGNHEQMMVDALDRPYMDWRVFEMNGGDKTIDNYNQLYNTPLKLRATEVMEIRDDAEWMRNLPLYLEFPDVKNDKGQMLVVSHSSLHAVWEKRNSKESNDEYIFQQHALWNRLPNIIAIDGVFNVFGHTPQEIEPRVRSCYANVDTGCCFAQYKEHGVLSAIQFPEMIIYQQENIDMPREDVDQN